MSAHVTSSAPVSRDKKPCAYASLFPRRLPKMAESQVGSLRGPARRGVQPETGLVAFSLRTCVVKPPRHS